MIVYRRKKDSDTWHWCRNCSKWPTSDYVDYKPGWPKSDYVDYKPRYGKLDDECSAIKKLGN